MTRSLDNPGRITYVLIPAFVLALGLAGQTSRQTDWRRIGNSAIELGLGGVATGQTERVWYSEDGAKLFVGTALGQIYSTEDFETWVPVKGARAPESKDATATSPPEQASAIRVRQASRGRFYAAGKYVYRSEDGGANWSNLTEYRGDSIIGEGVIDLAVSPRESDDITVAAKTGVWRSVDGGMTWTSLNAALPNLGFNRILATPAGVRGVRIATGTTTLEWAPGERTAWRPQNDPLLTLEMERNARLGRAAGGTVTASASVGDVIYAGTEDGRLVSSTDGGANWNPFRLQESGRIERIVVDPQDPRIALAVLGARPADLAAQVRGVHVLRTINAGVFWDDLTSNLADVAAHGIAFERSSGAIYVATDRGVFWTRTDLNALAPPSEWQSAGAGLPEDVVAVDVKLDSGGNQLYAGLAGLGVYSTSAPHRKVDPRVVNAADYSSRAAAPGSVLTVFGSEVRTAFAGGVNAPVLASNELRSEIQIPFDARGPVVALALDSGKGTLRFGLPLESVSPAIFIDRDGTPMVLDSDSGALLDASAPAHAGGRVQVLSSGLGRVQPDWPAGQKAPADNPPEVVARVHAYVNGIEVGVIRAVLAPGYIGLYLIEIQLPSIVNYGPAELMISVDGKESNRARIYVEP